MVRTTKAGIPWSLRGLILGGLAYVLILMLLWQVVNAFRHGLEADDTYLWAIMAPQERIMRTILVVTEGWLLAMSHLLAAFVVARVLRLQGAWFLFLGAAPFALIYFYMMIGAHPFEASVVSYPPYGLATVALAVSGGLGAWTYLKVAQLPHAGLKLPAWFSRGRSPG